MILVASQYGTRGGLLAATIAVFIYLLGPLPKFSILQEKNEYFFMVTKIPLLWFVSALVLGELRMKHIRERERLKKIAAQSRTKEKILAESYEALKKVKERLEVHVASEMPTVLMILDAFRDLQKCTKEEMISKASNLIKVLISPEKFSIYLLESNQLLLMRAEGWKVEDLYVKSFDLETPLFREVIIEKRALALGVGDADSLGFEGVLAAPIHLSRKGDAIGMIKIELMPFQNIKLSTLSSLITIGESIGDVYERLEMDET